MVGDPKWAPHPVQLIGYLITSLRLVIEFISNGNKLALRVGGLIITFLIVIGSGSCGWLIEQLTLNQYIFPNYLGEIILVTCIASGLAGKSLEEGVNDVIKEIQAKTSSESLDAAKGKLRLIVGRDVNHMDKEEILRATAETASENAIDGLFAPLFWLIIGTLLINISQNWPGPLSLIWAFKASSTIDSMIGYKKGSFKWLGTAGARLDDLLTWLPCRLTLITLPLISKELKIIPKIIVNSYREGSKYNSPNAGISQAIYANCIGIKLGGKNKYTGIYSFKPILGVNSSPPNIKSIQKIVDKTRELELLWITLGLMIIILFN